MFIYIAAGAESRTTVLRELLRGLTVRELMSTDVRTVTPETTVEEFFERVLADRTTAYPVMDRGTVTGFVTLGSVRGVSPEERTSTTVVDVMDATPPSIEPDADAFEALLAMSSSRVDRVFVLEDGRFVGQLTADDFTTALEVLQGIGPRRELDLPDGYA
jgi:CBS domain-containing protein